MAIVDDISAPNCIRHRRRRAAIYARLVNIGSDTTATEDRHSVGNLQMASHADIAADQAARTNPG